MSEDIPYGPEQKPWKESLSRWAKDGRKLLITPPSIDPLTVYSFPKEERDITPYLYQVPSTGLDSRQSGQAQAETAIHAAVQTESFLGYQTTMGNDYYPVSAYLSSLSNNIGDPFIPGSMTINTKWMERNVLDYYASLWNAKWPHNPDDPDTFWGYVLTMGSSEGNLYGMWNARDYLQGKFMMNDPKSSVRSLYVQARAPAKNPNAYTPIAFYSEDSHYSIVKTTKVLEIKTFYEVGTELYPDQCPLGGDWPTDVPSEGSNDWEASGSVDIDKLCKLVDFFTAKGYPALIIFNCGTTFKGAYDDVDNGGRRLMRILERNNMKERWVEITNPDDGTVIYRRRRGYWIHVDGALGASYMPFFRMAYQKHRTSIKPAPIFDFTLPFVCSIVTSAHKWPGSPWPTGIYMTKTGLQLLPPSLPGYIGSPDTTFAGSRNGLSTLIWWTYISTHDYDAQVKKLMHCLKLTEYTKDQLKKVEEDRGRCEDLWIAHSPLSLSVRFKKPNDDIVYKYTLANETLTMDTKDGMITRTYTHIYLMGGTTKEKLDELFAALRAPDAFPDQDQQIQIQRAQALRDYRAPKSAEDFHHGLRIGARDAGLAKGVKKLMAWPVSSRGYK